jgi:chromosome partitioning protein
MLTVLVINAKGGSGKTTLSTNIASYFASKQHKTAIIDYDPQGSSLQWLQARPDNAEKIHGANGAPPKGAVIQRSLQGWIPADIEVLVIDAPAGAKGLLLQEMVRRASFIVIPVTPSPIDIRATADFIQDLLLGGKMLTAKAKVAVVANRVRNPGSTAYADLERFLSSLKLPFLTCVRDSDTYLVAAEIGLGIFEMHEIDTTEEQRELMPIIKWLEGRYPNKHGSRVENKIISLEESKKWTAYRAKHNDDDEPGSSTGTHHRYPS